jgi:rod shape-determining protein MreC
VGWGEGSLSLRRELHDLRQRGTAAHLTQDRTLEIEEENQRLRELLGFQRRTEDELVSAVVVSRDRGRLGDVLFVELGPGAEVVEGAPAVVPEGLLGWAAHGGSGRIRVACLTNREVTLSVLDQRTRDEGISSWTPPWPGQLELHDVPLQADWRVGDRVITSGLGTVFPRGLLVGWVTGSETDEAGRGKRVQVRPAASPTQTEELFFLVRRASPMGEGSHEQPDPAGADTTR